MEEAEELAPSELFWFTKHGVRMTGMPAWIPTLTDQEIWDTVAFVRRLPKLTAAEYRRLDRPAATPPEPVT